MKAHGKGVSGRRVYEDLADDVRIDDSTLSLENDHQLIWSSFLSILGKRGESGI
jgi:hypothetical protein